MTSNPGRLYARLRRWVRGEAGRRPARGVALLRGIVVVLAATVTTSPVDGAQQSVRVPRIGFLSSGPASSWDARLTAFRQGLRELGWVEGKNIHIEYRYAEGRLDQVPNLAGDLVRLRVDVIVATSTPLIQTLKKLTNTIPIVMTGSADPVGMGFAASLARPGGNITGMSLMAPELAGKRLQLLRALRPKLSRVAFLAHGADPAHRLFIKEAQNAAVTFGIQVEPVIIRGPEEFEGAFSMMVRARVEALIVQPIFGPDSRIVNLAEKHRLLTVSDAYQFAEAGGLMYYGPDRIAMSQKVAVYIDKILKGTRPADLAVERPTKFEFVINLKAARALGITIPEKLLLQADRVIE